MDEINKPAPIKTELPDDELRKLRLDLKKITRQLNYAESLIERNRQVTIVKSNVNSLLLAEKTKQEKFMNLLLENSPDIIIMFDETGRFVYTTETFLRLIKIDNFGLINGKLFSEVFQKFTSAQLTKRMAEIFRESMSKKETIKIEEELDMSGTGVNRHYSINITPLLDQSGAVDGSIALFHDLTEIIKSKQQAEHASRAKTEFLANMSHEIRTPMNAIIGLTSIARSSNLIEKKDYCLEKIQDASAHLLGIINDILDMSKIEANKFELSFTEFNFEKMIMHTTNVINFKIEEKKQTLFVSLDPNIPKVIKSDEQRLSQVITNLLSNAVKFTPEKGSVTLIAELLSRTNGICNLRITVKDNGIGISKEQQTKLFHSFTQADGSISRRFGGTGLGLAISKNIVSLLDGDIWVESTMGEGASFIFTTSAQCSDSEAKPLLQNVNWSNIRILCVDDSQDVREYFANFGDSHNIYYDVAEDAFSAWKLIKKNVHNPYDIIFVDWMMPGMDGIELTEKIKRQDEDIATIPVIIMISVGEWTQIEKRAKEAGVDKFIPKPLFYSVLEDCINDCIGTEAEQVFSNSVEDYTDRFVGNHVLLAEDIEINREIVIELLLHTGVEIDCAENGLVACEMFSKNPSRYDLIFMDIHMPEMDGYGATRAIRAMDFPQAKTIPIVAMTANVFREDIEKCLAAGMNDHMGKPLDFDEVLTKLVKFIGK
ncbi:MAG: response regulator [Christensenellaceae bacterium]|jgi:PAS domain S-box-containing protein|nr:response regulator [Christensenellaceae bacterium]